MPLTPYPEIDRLRPALIKCKQFIATFAAPVYRVAAVKRANRSDLLSGEGSRLYGGRWNPPGSFRTVYASTDSNTALHEALAQNRRNGLPDEESLPLVVCAAHLQLSRVLDLTDGAVRKVLGVASKRMIAESHGTSAESITQAIGRLAWEQRLEGLVVPSAAVQGGVNVVVFPEILQHPDVQFQIIRPEDLPSDTR